MGFDTSYSFGPCCCCGREQHARNLVMLRRRAPVTGTGWGCALCGLPPDGAVYVCCDRCLAADRPPRAVIAGYPRDRRRVPVSALSTDVFDHDMRFHPGER